jgi:phage tail-like protein
MADDYDPPVAFHFDVTMLGDSATPEVDASFQEISGMDRELEVESLNEGGENRFTYQLPKRGKHPNLVLKRGLVTLVPDPDPTKPGRQSGLAEWAEETVGSLFVDAIEPKTLEVRLLNAERQPLIVWTFTNAYPVKWVTSSLNSTENKMAVETLEIAYAFVERKVWA